MQRFLIFQELVPDKQVINLVGKNIDSAIRASLADVSTVLDVDLNNIVFPKTTASSILGVDLREVISGFSLLDERFDHIHGYTQLAREVLESGDAFKKFEAIVKAQNGSLDHLKEPKFSYDIIAKRKMKIKHLDNKYINKLARYAGCPEDKLAGLYLHKKKGETAERGDKIITIYATSQDKLEYAKKFYFRNKKLTIYHS